jgi:hypothetical protein
MELSLWEFVNYQVNYRMIAEVSPRHLPTVVFFRFGNYAQEQAQNSVGPGSNGGTIIFLFLHRNIPGFSIIILHFLVRKIPKNARDGFEM